jgi:hypothetical protein
MLTLRLAAVSVNGARVAGEFAMIWVSDEFGEQHVGSIRRIVKSGWRHAERWEWKIDPALPVMPCRTQGVLGDCASAVGAFRAAFEVYFKLISSAHRESEFRSRVRI